MEESRLVGSSALLTSRLWGLLGTQPSQEVADFRTPCHLPFFWGVVVREVILLEMKTLGLCLPVFESLNLNYLYLVRNAR